MLSDEDRGVLRVFLASRGNMKELERHLGVSYPTARARFDTLLAKIGIDRPSGPPAPSRVELMEQVARGEIEPPDAFCVRVGNVPLTRVEGPILAGLSEPVRLRCAPSESDPTTMIALK